MKIKKISKVLILCLGLFFLIPTLILSVLAFIIWNDAKDINISSAQSIQPTQEQSSDVANCLEPESVMYEEDLKEFYLFSRTDEGYESWLRALFNKGQLVRQGSPSEIIVQKQLCLEALIENNCQEFYCWQHYLPFENVPSLVWKGLMGIEDNDFVEHKGVDLKAIIRAIFIDLKSLRFVQGGSTITQQLVKNLFLTNEKSFIRKYKELIYSFYIEAKFEKEEILAAYLNEVFWGGVQGIKIKGIYSASLFYFDKKPSELDINEMAILVGLLKGPGYFSPLKHPDRLKKRSLLVIEKLKELKLISDIGAKNLWTEKEWNLFQRRLFQKEKSLAYREIWSIQHLLKKEQKSVLSSFEQFVFRKSVRRVNEKNKDILDIGGYAVKAIIGANDNNGTFKFYSKIERNLETAIKDEKHQIGSIIKPLLYKIFFELGKLPNDKVSTAKISLPLKNSWWSPRESSEIKEKEVPLFYALQNSMNWPTVRTASELGLKQVEEKLSAIIPEIQKPLADYPAQLLGSSELSLQRIFDIYQVFISKECDSSVELSSDLNAGEILESSESYRSSPIEILSKPKLTTVKHILLPKLLDYKFFGKTGTTNNGNDNWYVAFNGNELFVIWFGNDAQRKTENSPTLFGSTTSFRIFQDFIAHRGRRLTELQCFFKK